jgi:hypothetical protein
VFGALGRVTLLTDLDAFYLDHRRCGELDGGVEEIRPGEWRVWFACTCGVRINRSADSD